MIKVGLMGYGKAGQAVAEVLRNDPRYELCWVARRTKHSDTETVPETSIPIIGLDSVVLPEWLDAHPVDALVDFSSPDAVFLYGEEVRKRKLMLVSAISAYNAEELDYVRSLGEDTRVLCSPNITLGINFLIMASKLLRSIAPFADVEILEQHFREKPEISGTARKIAESLDVDDERITSLRLGGIVGHHEVIFGFPFQTVRLIHNTIKREAFGTGAAFALGELATAPNGFYTFDDLLMKKLRSQINEA
ncbi:dihydrodipicolinate reductase C-terminal domain-containing protein [Rhodoferax sp.]|uniref:4-hydroxy-tetrahydrodipicolinate reductase n=1 Tax=Rhodoferax sp. TaxID=50421 RepID=UPI0025F73066|nr:dihydrodipicolinate reductase C-terminal domain-containing protein [Rhodoferax sp.]